MSRKQLTVGEMIASHHFRDALTRTRAEHAAFASTDVGRAFLDFENALAGYWQLDGQEHVSDKRLNAAADKADRARAVLRTHITRLM